VSRAFLAGLLLVAGCHHAAADPEPVTRPALTVVVGAEAASDHGYAGTLEGRYTSQLAFRVGGRVRRRSVSVGDHVRRGQELATLDNTSLRLAAKAAAADLAGATANRDHAALTLGRQNALLATGAAVPATAEDARTGHEVAGANVDEATARLGRAHLDLSDAVLRADFDGIVTRLDFEVEQVVAPHAPIGEIVRPNAVDFVFDVPERAARELVVGAPFEVTGASGSTLALHGAVREIGPAADRATRTRRIRLSIDIDIDTLPTGVRLGTTLYAKRGGEQRAGLRVPATAVLDDPAAPAVWIVDHDVVRRRPIVLGPRDADDFVVQSGLTSGDRVVVAGIHALREGQPVKHTEETAP
jgi:membrane fusion protein, multidrug efflux system